jgi:RNA polymerase sigma-70 factor (ECF subfamily)
MDTVHTYLARQFGAQIADEVASEVFVVAFEQRTRYRSVDGRALGWLLGIARNLARRRFRRDRAGDRALRLASAGQPGATVDAFSDVWSVHRDQALVLGVQRAIASLPDRDAEALRLRCWEELSYDEIAAVLEIPVGTVRSRISRAKQSIRTLLEQAGITATTGDDT